jgi:hypothetical protein
LDELVTGLAVFPIAVGQRHDADMHAVQEARLFGLGPRLRLHIVKRQERLVRADQKQASVVLGKDLAQRTIDGIEIGCCFGRPDLTDGKGFGSGQRLLGITPQIRRGRYAGHPPRPGLLRPTLQELIGHDDEVSAPGDPLELRAECPPDERIGRSSAGTGLCACILWQRTGRSLIAFW